MISCAWCSRLFSCSRSGLLVQAQALNCRRLRSSSMAAKILKISEEPIDRIVREGAAVLNSGGVVALPTDTIYGIAASVNSVQGIERLYKIKGRNKGKPIAICVGDLDDVDKWANVTVGREVLEQLLPGQVTLVFERRSSLPPALNPDTSLVGVRIPDHDFIRQLVRECGYPIALTSANISDTRSTLAVEEFKELWPNLDLVVDGGRIVEDERVSSRSGSTVVHLATQGAFKIVRNGSSYDHVVKILRDKCGLTETGSS
ncbi:threonylcarbamoyl-AMP synthase-like [Halichondria panicea]|uniref:threonylcarbamoyl-AMP synthase-like n=1 Tax=Halichondria panicea TaxID=6063 RepID=UPI00312BC1F8